MTNTPPNHTPPRWTLPELSARIALALSQASLSQDSGRIRDIPNARTIRYYTTIGLLDRPLAFDGRTALYGPRHLLQLIAIKRLQSQNQTLEEIQHRLLALSDDALSQIANIPKHILLSDIPSDPPPIAPPETPPTLSPIPSPETEPIKKTPFWIREPAPLAASSPASPPGSEPPIAPKLQNYPIILVGLALRPDASLVLSPDARPLSSQDIEAIQAAAEPLLRVLETRKLIKRPEEL
jgi:DNA-binding transcriptional MerR regulator